jgi:cytochrome b pre-mRNA-processing protein 3
MPIMQSLAKLFARPDKNPAVTALYNVCVAQARAPEFYRILSVPDTVDGRFDLLLLHMALIMRRLNGEAEIKQQLFDLMFADMDQSLREMGVGDMSIGKRIRPMIGAFYGRSRAYEQALSGSDEVLGEAVARNVYGKAEAPSGVSQKMADYVRRAVVKLDQQPQAEINEGRVDFPVVVIK